MGQLQLGQMPYWKGRKEHLSLYYTARPFFGFLDSLVLHL
jgi:hypothetical protein